MRESTPIGGDAGDETGEGDVARGVVDDERDEDAGGDRERQRPLLARDSGPEEKGAESGDPGEPDRYREKRLPAGDSPGHESSRGRPRRR